MNIRTMTTATLVAGLAAATGGYAHSAEVIGEASMMPPSQSIRSRADVREETLAAIRGGQIPQGECAVYQESPSTGDR